MNNANAEQGTFDRIAPIFLTNVTTTRRLVWLAKMVR